MKLPQPAMTALASSGLMFPLSGPNSPSFSQSSAASMRNAKTQPKWVYITHVHKIYQALPPLFLLAGQKSYVRNMRAEEGGPGNEARPLHITNIESTPYQNILPTLSPHCQMLVSFDVIALFTNITWL